MIVVSELVRQRKWSIKNPPVLNKFESISYFIFIFEPFPESSGYSSIGAYSDFTPKNINPHLDWREV